MVTMLNDLTAAVNLSLPSSWVSIILDYLHGAVFYMYFLYVLTPKWNKKYNPLYVLLSALAYVTFAYMGEGWQKSVEGIPFVVRYAAAISFLTMLLIVVFGFKDTFRKKFLHITLLFVQILLTDALSTLFIFAIDPESRVDNAGPAAFAAGKLLFIFIIFPLTAVVGRFFRKKDFILPGPQMFVFSLFSLMEFVMLLNSLYVYNGQYNTQFFAWFLVELALCIVVNVLILYVLRKAATKDELEQQLTLSQLQSVHTRQIEEDNAQLRMLRHDVKNTLATAEILLQKGETAQAERFLHDFHTSIDRESKTAYCQNAIVNSVLLLKAQQAKKAGFHLKCDVFCPHEIAIDAFDLCSLFSNLLDNAIDHADRSQSSELLISAWQNKNDYVIRCQNRFAPERTVRNRLGKTNQGLGLSIIKKTVKKYDGTMDIQKDENFTITLWLKAGSGENA